MIQHHLNHHSLYIGDIDMLPVNDNHEKPETRLWEALEGRAKELVCGTFMAMGTVLQGDTEIFLYKSIKTRRYVKIDIEGNYY